MNPPPSIAATFWQRREIRFAALFGALTVALHIASILWGQHLGYGYFRDEFYYLACGHHLAWGFVDHGPIVALQARLAETLFGPSVLGIRTLSLLAHALAVALTVLLTASFGGRRPAQALAALAFLLAPVAFGTGDYLSMNSSEPVFWTLCVLLLVHLARGAARPLPAWTLFGASAGIGLLNKPSMTFFLLALLAGLLLTRERRLLFTPAAALGIALLILIALPNVFWQIHNHWPTLEFLHNGAAEGKNTILSPPRFLLAQVGQMNPLSTPLWIAGIVSLLRARTAPGTRFLGIAAVLFFAGMCLLHAKDYYLAPIYPTLFAAGAAAFERFVTTRRGETRSTILPPRRARFAVPAYAAVLVLTGLILLPMASPILTPAAWVAYTRKLHLVPDETENAESSILPQFFADRFGWTDYTSLVLQAVHSLSPADGQRVCISAENYGEAGALDFLARRQDPHLPPVFSGHNSYWTWGPHGCDGSLLIAITADTPEQIHQTYRTVTLVGTMSNPLAMPYERKHVYIVRDRLPTRPFLWPKRKHYI